MSNIFKLFFILLSVNFLWLQVTFRGEIPRYTSEEFIEMHGYPVESHYVTTSDGYILNLHRIPYGKRNKSNGKVVFLAHGIWTSSMLWLFTGAERSLAFFLADEGYDVWMNNDRGNDYSRNHTILDPESDSQFWNFSWHEIAIYDLPASVDYVLQYTNQTALYFVGISEGATIMYVLLSMKPEYNTKIKLYVHMAPLAFMAHTKTPILTVPAAIMKAIKDIVPITGGIEAFSGKSSFTQSLATFSLSNWGKFFCEKLYYTICGYSYNESDSSLFHKGLSLALRGGSSKQFFHYVQLIESGHFRQYDFGKERNLLEYGDTTPTEYDLSKVTAPGYLIYAGNDDVSDNITDVPKLYSSLGNCLGKFLVPVSFNHVDFLFGVSAPSVVYPKIIKLLSQH